MQNNLHVIWHYNQKYFTKNKDIKRCHFDPSLIKVLSYYSVFVLHYLKSRICFLFYLLFVQTEKFVRAKVSRTSTWVTSSPRRRGAR